MLESQFDEDPDLEPGPFDIRPARTGTRRCGEHDLNAMRHRQRNEAENAADMARLTPLGAIRDLLEPPPEPGWRCGKPHCTACASPQERIKKVQHPTALPTTPKEK